MILSCHDSVEHCPQPRHLSRRTEFWVIFLTLVLVFLGFLLPGYLQRVNAARTVSLLRPLLRADARFSKITISQSTLGCAILRGSVVSNADALALRRVVEQAHPPQEAWIMVEVATPDAN